MMIILRFIEVGGYQQHTHFTMASMNAICCCLMCLDRMESPD